MPQPITPDEYAVYRQACAHERARIVWWLRAAAGGPASPGTHPEYLQACLDLADVIEHDPYRFADAPPRRPDADHS